MNREDIIRMAREAGLDIDSWEPLYEGGLTGFGVYECTHEELERFAALVASAEGEAIAQMIEDAPALMEFAQNDQGGCLMCGFTPKLAAKAIRARGQV